jgi:hypothetical protein
MMPQNETSTNARSKRTAPDWRGSAIPKYEIPYLMKLGNLSREAAAALIDRYNGDRDDINAELVARRRNRSTQ